VGLTTRSAITHESFMSSPQRPAYVAIIELDGRLPCPIPTDTLAEAEALANAAAQERPVNTRVPIYTWREAREEYVLLETLESAVRIRR
jgi:hypothetical protein